MRDTIEEPTKKQLAEAMVLRYPEAASRAIARLLVEEHPLRFSDIEIARKAVRTVRGNAGNYDRRWATIPKPNGQAGEHRIPKMPESLAQPRVPFLLPPGRVLILSDLHVPYHTPEAIQKALAYREFDAVLLNGDVLDFHRLSRFTHDTLAVGVKEELHVGRQMLEYLASFGAPIYYKVGNHEERLQDYLMSKAPDLAELDAWKLDHLLGFEDLGVTLIDNRRIVDLAGLNILHGHELNKGFAPPVNPARGAFLKANANTLIGHHHKTSSHAETDVRGNLTGCWSTGCLCNLSPNYAPYAKTNHGFAFVEATSTGFVVQNKMIQQGEIY